MFLSESLTGHFFVFYDLLAAPPFVENQKFAIMATRRINDAQFLLFARLSSEIQTSRKEKVKKGIRKKKRQHFLNQKFEIMKHRMEFMIMRENCYNIIKKRENV